MIKRSKFNVRTDKVGKLARTLDGVVYDSVAERNYAAELQLLKKTGEIEFLQRQVHFPLRLGEKLICTHVVDFYYRRRFHWEVAEVKGYETEVWKLKRKLFEACYPNIKYVVVKPKRK